MSFLTKLAIGAVFVGILIYVFGIPPQVKRKLERGALQAMGENKASYVIKNQIGKIPTTDQRDINTLKRQVGQATDSLTKNPLGEQAGEALDDFTSGFTGP